ncbi:hypothetical protein TNCT_362591 [Trichonephila clavata]|uniref:Uncharacterized protein n=1 Tax=Trichonephila clavata TaxID=2740835 RepID=A0A8X6LZ49_TRICU|nr:hypothetical protein TNCT_362591 [Trichonephila clavata]
MSDSKFIRYSFYGDMPVCFHHVIHLPHIFICSGQVQPSMSRYVLHLLTSITELAAPSALSSHLTLRLLQADYEFLLHMPIHSQKLLPHTALFNHKFKMIGTRLRGWSPLCSGTATSPSA